MYGFRKWQAALGLWAVATFALTSGAYGEVACQATVGPGPNATETLRDQFTPEGLVAVASEMAAANAAGQAGCVLDVPDFDWTGEGFIPTLEDLPLLAVDASSLNGDQLAERILSLAALLLYELDPVMRYSVLSNDVGGAAPLVQGRGDHATQMRQVMEGILERVSAGEIEMQETRELGLLLAITHYKSTEPLLNGDDIFAFEYNFTQIYSGPIHRYYNYFSNRDATGIALPGYGQWWSWNFFSGLPASLLEPLDEEDPDSPPYLKFISGMGDGNIALIPQAWEFEAEYLETIVAEQRSAVGRYFTPRVYLDPGSSQLFDFAGVDPDGYAKPEELIVDPYLDPGTAGNATWPQGYAVDFKDLAVDGEAFPGILWYDNPDSTPTLGFKTLVETLADNPSTAASVLEQSEEIWNEKIKPKWVELADLAQQRLEQSQDDFFTGAWRAKIGKVLKVNRDPQTGQSVSFVVESPSGYPVVVPSEPFKNKGQLRSDAVSQAQAALPPGKARGKTNASKGRVSTLDAAADEIEAQILATQEGIKEMDTWYEAALASSQGLHPGDPFNLVEKVVESRGICGPDYGTGTDPYESVSAIVNNYTGVTKIVGQDAPLTELVFESGSRLASFLYEVREFLANEYVKENWEAYGFASREEAGVCKTSPVLGELKYERIRDDILEKTESGYEKSDLAVLGRHYGYDEDGKVIPEEWEILPAGEYGFPQATGPLRYVAPDVTRVEDEDDPDNPSLDTVTIHSKLKYTYQEFDYIYRHHYAVDPEAPLSSDNDSDPNRGNGERLYQWADDEDVNFIAAFRRREVLTSNDLEPESVGAVFLGPDLTPGGDEYTKSGTYYRWKADWIFQKLSGFVIVNAVQQKLLPPLFVQQYFSSTFEDTNGDTCGFGLADIPEGEIRSRFRLGGQTGGSANSSSGPSLQLNRYQVFIRLTTTNPAGPFPNLVSQNQLFLHEGALGHGFDGLPDGVDFLREIDNPLSWVTNVNNNGGFKTPPFGVYTYPHIASGYATLGEGWATYGEILGVIKGLTVDFDEVGCPLPAGNLNLVAAFNGMVDLSRVSGRQVVDVGMNSSKYAWTFYHSVSEFNRITDLPIGTTADFYMRFIGHPTQQTTYASGLVTNLGILSTLAAEAESRDCVVDEPEFNQFRITRTDYILGAPLSRIVLDNIDPFLKTPDGQDCPIEEN